MSSVRHHLRKLHSELAEHHTRMAKIHSEAAKGEVEGEPWHTFHTDAAAAHCDMAESHVAMADACAKAATGDLQKSDMGQDGDELQPVGDVSTVYPAGHRAVPRFGGPEVPATAVHPDFQKIVAVDEGE